VNQEPLAWIVPELSITIGSKRDHSAARVDCPIRSHPLRTKERANQGGGLYFTVPSSPSSHARVSALRIGSGWPQSTQRSLRPPVSFTSMSLIALWHIGQSGAADWV